MELDLSLPFFYIAICPLIAFLATFLLYKKDNNLDKINSFFRWCLFLFRFSIISILVFLLLKPVIKSSEKITENPIAIIAHDNSQSILFGKDSLFYKTNYLKELKKVSEKLSNKFQVDELSFSEEITFGFDSVYNKKYTDFSSLFNYINNQYLHKNVSAIVISSDGIYNKGKNPIYLPKNIVAPIYGVALGDTAAKKDATINSVRCNKISYLGNTFPVEISTILNGYKGEEIICECIYKGKVIDSQKLISSKKNDYLKFNFNLQSKETGIQRYQFRIKYLPDEFTYINNMVDAFVDVLDSKQKILVLSDFPHPDLAAIKNSLSSKKDYEVNVELIKDIPNNIENYSLVISYQLPFNESHIKFLKKIKEQKIPIFSIIGPNTSLSMFNNLFESINVSSSLKNQTDDIYPLLNNGFSLFNLSDKYSNYILELPPLIVPFSDIEFSSSFDIFLNQKLGPLDINKPLLFFTKKDSYKNAFLMGEGIWRWKFEDYSKNQSHSNFNELLLGIIQYLSVEEDNSRFKIISNNSFFENQNIEFEAELYNKSYQLVNSSDISIVFTDENLVEYSFDFSPNGDSYYLDAGNLLPGIYTFNATTILGTEKFNKKGEIKVIPVNLESINSVANHNLLLTLANNSNGRVYYASDLDNLSDDLLSNNTFKSTFYFLTNVKDLIHKKMLFFILLILLSSEWFLRKYLSLT